jgi:hypothetical protein
MGAKTEQRGKGSNNFLKHQEKKEKKRELTIIFANSRTIFLNHVMYSWRSLIARMMII